MGVFRLGPSVIVSRITSRDFLSSRSAINRECRRWLIYLSRRLIIKPASRANATIGP